MEAARCCIRFVAILLLVFAPEMVMAQGVALSPKEALIAAYFNRLEGSMLRLQEEERMLRKLSQEQIMTSLPAKQVLREGPEPVFEQRPKKSVLGVSRGILETMFADAEFRTSLGATVEYNDNVGLDHRDTKSDWIYHLRPRWDLKLTRGQSYLGIGYNYDFGYYLNGTSPDSHAQTLSATLFYKPSNIFSFQLDETFEGTKSQDLFKLVPFSIDRFNRGHHRVHASNLAGVLTYMPWGRTNLAHLTFSDRRAYSKDRSLESNSQDYGFNIEHYLTPISSVYLGMEFGMVRYEGGRSKNNDTQSLVLGLQYDLSNISKAQAKLSYDSNDYEDGTDDEGYKLDCSLSHKLSNFTGITGTYSFGLDNSVSEEYRRYHTHDLALSLNHQFSQKLSLSLGTTYTLDNYFKEDYLGTEQAADKERRQYGFTFGLGHKLYNWLDVNFTYKHARVLSEFADEDYVNNVYTWGATFSF